MAIEFDLVVAGDVSLEALAARAFQQFEERWTRTPSSRVIGADLYEECGFEVTVLPGDPRYGFSADGDDDAYWEWEPPRHLTVGFRFDKFRSEDRWEDPYRRMVEAAKRVLDTGQEDAALVFVGGQLLLTRMNGELRKHNRVEWWDHLGFVNEIIDG